MNTRAALDVEYNQWSEICLKGVLNAMKPGKIVCFSIGKKNAHLPDEGAIEGTGRLSRTCLCPTKQPKRVRQV